PAPGGRQARHLASTPGDDKRREKPLWAKLRLGDFVLENALHLEDQILEMKRLREHLGAWRLAAGLERHGREAGDEHDASVRADLGTTLRQLDPVHFRHDDVG